MTSDTGDTEKTPDFTTDISSPDTDSTESNHDQIDLIPVITQPSGPLVQGQSIHGTGNFVQGSEFILRRSGVPVSGNFQRGDSWTFTPTTFSPGNWVVTAEQIVNGWSPGQSASCSFTVIPPKVVITLPSSPVEQNQVITCTDVWPGDPPKILDAAGRQVPGKFTPTGTGTSWTFAPNPPWEPGNRTIKAVQTVNGMDSIPSECSFAVRPLPPVITNPGVVWTPKPTLRGTGVAGATVTLHRQNDPNTVYGTVEVESNGHWTTPLTTALSMADPFNMTAKQVLNGMTSAWAENTGFPVLFKPVISGATVSADGKPTVSGTGGLKDARLEIYLSGGIGGVQLTTTFLSNGTWTVTSPTAWPINQYTITAKQIGKNSGKSSDWAVVYTFVVKPLKPEIINPAYNVITDLSPPVSGKGLSGAILTLRVEGDLYFSKEVKVAGTWDGVVDEPLPAGNCAMSVVQTLNGQPSDPVVRHFRVRPPIPVITRPASFGLPNMDAGGHRAYPGATLEVHNDYSKEIIPGEITLIEDRWTFIPTLPWKPGNNSIFAKQIVEGVTSLQTSPRSFKVMPPELLITSPGLIVEQNQVISGNGAYPGAELRMQQNQTYDPVLGEFTKDGTAWTFTPNPPWVPGDRKIVARQSVDDVTSGAVWCDFKVRPPTLDITPPNTPLEPGQSITGTGYFPQATITLRKAGREVAGTFTSDGANWAFTINNMWPSLDWVVTAEQTVNGVTSTSSLACSFEVRPPRLQIDEPQPGVTVEQNQAISGKGSLHYETEYQMLDAFDEDVPGQFNIPTQYGWRFTPAPPWEPGERQVKVKQIVSGVPSLPTELLMFKVRPPTLVITPPNTPLEPGQSITGTGYFPQATITLRKAGRVVAGTFTSDGANWAFTINNMWPSLDWVVTAEQTVNGVTSTSSLACSFEVRPPRLQIDEPQPGVTVEQNQAISGKGSLHYETEYQMLDAFDEDVPGQFNIPTQYGWRFTPAPPWEPGERQVKVKQIVSGVPSLPTELLMFKVRPPKPSITAPTSPVAADYPLTITGVYNGTAALQMLNAADTEVSGTFSGTGPTRTFTPDEEWAPGTNTVKVVQTVNDVASDPSDECTFTVEEGDKPEAPKFQLPYAYTSTSTRPIVKVTGLPLALMTVRLACAEVLHAEDADAEGNLEFRVDSPLIPGDNALEVKQKGNGPESHWSEPHPFIVKEPPITPVIKAPGNGQPTPRKPVIRGEGETRGQILLRHENDPDNLIDTIAGRKQWTWTAKEAWPVGDYAIQVKQTDDGDSSEWSQPRKFKVVQALFGIGDAGPVLGQPVVGTGQSTLLRVQVLEGDTGAVAGGVTVEWRISGEQDVIATTETDQQGWARYLYTPDAAGKHEVLADITTANQGVVMTQLFEVTALSHDAWAQEAGLYLDDQLVDLAKGDLVLLSGKPHELELRVNSDSSLIGSSVTLQDLWGAAERGLQCVPELGAPQPVLEGKPVSWSISSATQDSGFFGLNLTSPALPDWQLPGRVEAGDFAEAVDVDFDTFPRVFGGDPAYPCHGATHTFTVRPKPASPLSGMDVKLDWLGEAAPILGISVSPDLKDVQRLGPDGLTWTLNCVDSLKNGRFSLRLSIPELDFNSLDLTLSFGHNLVTAERWSKVIEGSGEQWTQYGLRATSTFLNRPAPGVQVVIQRSNTDTPSYETTNAAGEVTANAYNGTSLSMNIHNGYDGTIV